MAVYTSGGSSVHYGFENTATFGTAASSINKTFGLNASVTNLSVNTNRMELAQLGQVEPQAYAYGAQAGSMSIGFTFDDTNSQDIFQSLYGEPSGNTTAWSYPASSTTPLSHSTSPSVINSLSVQIDQQLTGAYDYSDGSTNTTATRLRRTMKGCVVTGLGISTSVGGTVDGTVEMVYGKEEPTAEAGGTIANQTPIAGKPLTFAHGSFKLSDGSAIRTLGEIQSANCNFGTNANLLYQLGSHYSVNAFRQIFDITGNFNTTFKTFKHLDHVLKQAIPAQVGVDGVTTNDDVSSVGAELVFTSGNKHITIDFAGVTFDSHSTEGLVPVQPVFESLPFKARAARIVTRTAA